MRKLRENHRKQHQAVRRRQALTAVCPHRLISLLLVSVVLVSAHTEILAQDIHPPYPGLLIIEAARDSTKGFSWVDVPELNTRTLVWPSGVLTVPADIPIEEFGVAGLAFPYSELMTGISRGRHLLFVDGSHRIDQPLLLTDGELSLYAATGEIIIEAGRVLYRPQDWHEEKAEDKANYLILAGIILAIILLMTRARSRLRKG